MYNCILVGFDGSEASRKAVYRAAALASKLGSKLIVATVVPTPSMLLGELLVPQTVQVGEILESVREGLEKVVERVREETGVQAEAIVVEGDPASTLLEIARSRGCGLIVVGRRGRGLAAKILGSVSSKLISIARGVDVLVVEPG